MKVEDFKNRNTLSVPEGYFESLQSKVASKTCRDGATAAKGKRGLGWRSIGYAAAMLVFVCLIAFNGTGNKQSAGSTILAAGTEQTPADGTENIAEEEFMDNLLDNYPIDDYTFYCYLTDTDMN